MTTDAVTCGVDMKEAFNESTVEEAALSWFDELGRGEIRVADADNIMEGVS